MTSERRGAPGSPQASESERGEGPPREKIAKPLPHESARGHVTGDALYTDDLVGRFPQLLHAWPVLAPHAHALVTRLDVTAAMQAPGVAWVLTDADVISTF